jgi:chemosensory pili system protein ChpE
MTLFVASFLLGIAFCAPPGAITAESIRRGFARGFRPALFVQFGSLVGDATWAIIALVGLAFLVQNTVARLLLGVVGGGLLLYLAWGAFRDGIAGGMPTPRGESLRGDFATGAFLSLGNPWNIAFWLGAGSSALTTYVAQPQLGDYFIFFSAFMTGAIVWCFFAAGLIGSGRNWITPGFFRWVNLLCSVFLAYLGVQLLIQTVRGVVG